jgi:hypothetical protein
VTTGDCRGHQLGKLDHIELGDCRFYAIFQEIRELAKPTGGITSGI